MPSQAADSDAAQGADVVSAMPAMKPEQQIQDDQYAIPYHYLPTLGPNSFQQHAYWSWGYRYLGGMTVARSLCDEEPYSSLLDIGCGDGRFIRDLGRDAGTRKLLGVDYSERAINLAKGLNPQLDYRVCDILVDDLGGEKFDVVTAIEVIEHVPPDVLPQFLARAVEFLRPGGRLVITVPHRNKRLNEKHFQHFDSTMIATLLDPHLEGIRFQPFDFPSRILDLWFRLLGRTGQYYLVTWKPALAAFYRYYVNRCLFDGDESKCWRIACVGRKPNIHSKT